MDPDKNPSRRDPRTISPSILDRFRSRLKERERMGPCRTQDIVRLYEDFLAELTTNSKPIITDLIIVAGEEKEHAEGIAMAICDRILKAPMEQKLPSLYLLDSIAKNVGQEYLRIFADRLPEVFCVTYRRLNPSLHPSMVRLFKTRRQYFLTSVRSEIEVELQLSLKENQKLACSGNSHSGSQSPHPLHGVNVNPKYSEAHHQTKHSAVDVPHTRFPISFQSYRPISSFQNREYDLNHHELLPPRPKFERTGTAAMSGVKDTLPHSKPLSPSKITLKVNNYPERVDDRVSLSGYGAGRPSNCNSVQNPESSVSYNQNNGCDKLRARLLISAYGSKDALHEKLPKFQRLDPTVINSDNASKHFRGSEEEHIWESMSPTLGSQNRQHNPTPFGCITGLTMPNAASLGKDFGSYAHNQAHLARIDDANITANPGLRSFSYKCHDNLSSPKEPWLHFQSLTLLKNL